MNHQAIPRKIRIGGVVKLANQIQQKLQAGISSAEADRLQQIVAKSVQQIEKLCSQHQIPLTQLPIPSRRAYYFLKNVSLTSSNSVTSHPVIPTTLQLKNVLKQQAELQQQLFQIAQQNTEISRLRSNLNRYTTQIESICARNQVTPAALAAPSRIAYAWMKFLSTEHYLQLHLNTLRRAINLGEKIIAAPQTAKNKFFISLTPGSNLYQFQTVDNYTTIKISEGFIQSSDQILQAVLQIALQQKTAAASQLIRQFGQTPEYSDVILEIDRIVEITAEIAQGKCYDLDELFGVINQQYFGGKMAKPRLIWDSFPTDRKFGHYEHARDRVVISSTLDDLRVPQYVAEFVLYHELLHKQQGAQWINGKCWVHTPEFRRSERQFLQYLEAESCLKQLAKGHY